MNRGVKNGKYAEWISENGLLKIKAWARDGLTEEQIAHNIGVQRSTLSNWKVKYPEILDALKSGKEVADIIVENALFKRATGYDVEETRTEASMSDVSATSKKMVKIKKHIAPDVAAAIFWLKNRKPAQWRDRPAENDAVYDIEDDPITAAIREETGKK